MTLMSEIVTHDVPPAGSSMVFDEEKPFSGQLSGKLEHARNARRAYGGARSGTQKSGAGFSAKDARQRVVVKVSYVKLSSAQGMQKARAHLKYLEREGVAENGERGELFTAVPGARVDRQEFLDRAEADPHMFRVILSPELGGRMDLQKYARDFVQTLECDRGSKLDWCGVAHYNTDHPHVHLVIRGVQADGRELRFEKPYIQETMREHARDIATLELGERSLAQVHEQQRGEIEKQRWTDLDRIIEREFARDAQEQREQSRQLKLESAVFARDEEVRRNALKRLQFLETMELATRVGLSTWEVSPRAQEVLKECGRQQDIQKRLWEARVEQAQSGPLVPGEKVQGKLVGRGLADEARGKEYLVLSDLVTGKARYIELDREREYERARVGDVVTVTHTAAPQSRVVVQSHGDLSAQQRANHPTWLDRQAQEVGRAHTPELKLALASRQQHLEALGIREADPTRRVAELAKLELQEWMKAEHQRRERERERPLVSARDVVRLEGRVRAEVIKLHGSLHVVVEGRERDMLVPATKQLMELRGQQVEGRWEQQEGAGRAQLVVRAAKQNEVER